MTSELLDAAVRIGDQLCSEAIRHDGKAVWVGDERTGDGPGGVVHQSLGGDLYGGSAGIAMFLAELWRSTGDRGHRSIALEGLEHAVSWCDRHRPGLALHTGAGGVAVALDRAARALDAGHLEVAAGDVIDECVDRPVDGSDLISGAAGAIVAALALERHRPTLTDRAVGLGERLVTAGTDLGVGGVGWPERPGEPALCGLGHGASGPVLALELLASRCDDPELAERFRATAERGVAYERAWFRRDEANWPDLREFTRVDLLDGRIPPSPAYWCHGAVGIGLTRLLRYRVHGLRIDAAEAMAATVSSARSVARMVEHGGVMDGSVCHGAAGVAEFLLEAGAALDEPSLDELGVECLLAVIDAAGDARWPIGVPGGSHNPSLMLGTAGIGYVLLRAAVAGTPRVGAIYDLTVRTNRIIVQLATAADAAGEVISPDEVVSAVLSEVPGGRVERVSARGRLLITVPDGVDADGAIERISQRPDIQYAERDDVERAQEG